MRPSHHRHRLRDIVHDFALFALHSSKPYARLVTKFSSERCQRVLVGREPGVCDYLNRMRQPTTCMRQPTPDPSTLEFRGMIQRMIVNLNLNLMMQAKIHDSKNGQWKVACGAFVIYGQKVTSLFCVLLKACLLSPCAHIVTECQACTVWCTVPVASMMAQPLSPVAGQPGP